MLVCSDADVEAILDFEELLSVVADAFRAQGAGAVERPPRPHFDVGHGLSDAGRPLGTGLTMTAYIHGADHYATKLASVFPENDAHGLPTVQAQLALTDARTGEPTAYMAATQVTNARTGCIAGLAAHRLSVDGPVRLALIGAGALARTSARAVASATTLQSIRVYSPSDSRHECAADLDAFAPDVTAVESPADAVADATVVVTATTSETPVFDGNDLPTGTVVVALGAYTASMQEVDERTVGRAATVFGDVPGEVAETGDMQEAGVDEDDIVPFSDVVDGRAGREHADEILLVDSVGSATLDAAAAEYVYDRALDTGRGETVSL